MYGLLPFWFIAGSLLCWCTEMGHAWLIAFLDRRLEARRFTSLGEIVAGQMDNIQTMKRFSALHMQSTAEITDPEGLGWTIIVELDSEAPALEETNP